MRRWSEKERAARVRPLAERFWSRVDKSPGFGPNGDCWPWTGYLHKGGYGILGVSKKGKRRATHLSWELEHGQPFPEGLCARHACDNPPCVNPSHIIPGTRAQNVADMIERGRRFRRVGQCKHGHPLEGDNLAFEKSGSARCRICRRTQQNARWPKIREARAAKYRLRVDLAKANKRRAVG